MFNNESAEDFYCWQNMLASQFVVMVRLTVSYGVISNILYQIVSV